MSSPARRPPRWEAGGSHVRVIGSVATGTDRVDSDVDLLFTMGTPVSLLQLGDLERRIARTLDVPVDLVPDTALRPEIRDRVLAEAAGTASG